VYIELTINDKLIRINKNNAIDLYSWRENKTKTPYWFKMKPTQVIHPKTGYKRYRININRKHYNLSRLVYKAHNNDWDITDNSKNNLIDHININSLDNRIENLRILTNQQNRFNTKAKGYSWNKRDKKWNAQIKIGGKAKHLGVFTEEVDAHNAYLTAKEIYHKLPA
tara:strand:+ start:58 stop:558 length:501 start_codon:yes stop_codon:yes gene_type:complete